MKFCADSLLKTPDVQSGEGGSHPTSALHIFTISKSDAARVLSPHHYLSSRSKGFKSGINFGLFESGELKGVCIFTGLSVPELVVGMFGLPRTEQLGFFELSRLCLTPDLQGIRKNVASWFVARSIRLLRKQTAVRAVLSYADAEFHKGTVYRACGFKYYGLSKPKKDFWRLNESGMWEKCSRGGSIKSGIIGEWKPRSQKHRFVLVFDSLLKIRWVEQSIYSK